MEARETAVKIAAILDKKKALDVKVLDIHELTTLGDYFVICNGTSSTHIKALADEMEFQMKQEGILPNHSEGYTSASWILLDYGNVIVHVFTPDAKDFYSLERLWSDAPEVALPSGEEA